MPAALILILFFGGCALALWYNHFGDGKNYKTTVKRRSGAAGYFMGPKITTTRKIPKKGTNVG